ncbi:MAG: MFS transporter, partial [Conexibacter sp.]
WLRELSLAGDAADPNQAARRATVAMTAGFALGPLVAGMLAQWAPDARVLPYLPHLVLMAVLAVALRRIPETVAAGRHPRHALRSLAGLRSARFRRVVVPLAPWVFAAPAVAFALLPAVVDASRSATGIAVTGGITFLCALAGVLVQPLARRLGADARANWAASVGLALLAGGLGLAAFTARQSEIWLLAPCALVLGAAYGLCMVGGLADVQRLADAESMAGMTAVYYALTYLGFTVPYLAALAAHVASYELILAIGAGGAAMTAAHVASRARADTAR